MSPAELAQSQGPGELRPGSVPAEGWMRQRFTA
jgi:hypothetical protein